MTKAEEKALEAYPFSEGKVVAAGFGSISFDQRHDAREGFIKGYEQAEKDIILKIKSRIAEVVGDAQPNPTIRIELFGIIDSIRNDLNTEL